MGGWIAGLIVFADLGDRLYFVDLVNLADPFNFVDLVKFFGVDLVDLDDLVELR